MKKAVIVTGTNGGIGAEIKKTFQNNGYAVIGIDKSPDVTNCDEYICFDFSCLGECGEKLRELESRLGFIIKNYQVSGLINNSAVQNIKKVEDLELQDIEESMRVNFYAPIMLAKFCLQPLINARGVILNIGSIHSELTKPGFSIYAASKGALQTMTKALAVELGGRVRVNMIAPAAIATNMLKAGFYGDDVGYQRLRAIHPTGEIGDPSELADFIYMLVAKNYAFLNGSIIKYDGGISSLLCDPKVVE
ncbi:SDR family NAD(P)-dependent oxidoreductase [Spongiibacter tropicus]|uniref:SDR family NAD(P)-dependent oxidoreductase n=1 Tax=Spongiibacter tropicus TaxID=454602 RepID=UPI003A98FD05